jgi:predicted porin
MKKTLIALAAFSTLGVANAQSSATISGTIAAGWIKSLGGDKGLVLDSNSIKFDLVEDLGNGLKVSAATQFAGNSGRGGNVTKEDSSIALSGGFGSLAFQNTRTSSWAVGYGMVANQWLWDGVYSSNAGEVFARKPTDVLTYTSPSFSGVNLVASYGEKADNAVTPTTKTSSLGAKYSAGPLSAGIRYNHGSNSTWGSNITKSNFEAGANYDFGVAKVGLGLDGKRVGNDKSEKAALTAGVSVPFGKFSAGLNYAKRDESNVTELGLNYSLSKRSSVYANYGRTNFASGLKCNQANLVLVHSF